MFQVNVVLKTTINLGKEIYQAIFIQNSLVQAWVFDKERILNRYKGQPHPGQMLLVESIKAGQIGKGEKLG